MKPTVMLIDFSNLFWTAVHTNGDSVSTIRTRTREAIDRAAGTVPGSLVAVCCDKGRSFRKGLYDAYKAQRPDKDQAVLAEMDRTKESLRAAGYVLLEADGFEADDVIATAATVASAAGHPFCVASADKDLLQLLELPDSSALRTHQWSIVRAVDVVTKFGIEPEGLGDWLALVGDASDNIKGCPGVGEKRATDLLIKHGGLIPLMEKVSGLQVFNGAVETMTPAAKAIATPAVIKALWENREAIALARKLVTLRTDAPIKFDDILTPPVRQEERNVDDLISGPEVKKQSEKEPANEVVAGQLGQAAPVVHIETRALAPTVGFERQLEPFDPGGAIKLAQYLFDSRLYSRFGTWQAVLAVIMRGRSMGMEAITALDCFHVIEGRPSPYAFLLIARAKSHPDCEYFQLIESTPQLATWETKNRRNPKPTRVTYHVEQARAAGLVKPKSNWETRPGEMCVARSGAQLARIEYPSVFLGLTAVEEADEERAAA